MRTERDFYHSSHSVKLRQDARIREAEYYRREAEKAEAVRIYRELLLSLDDELEAMENESLQNNYK